MYWLPEHSLQLNSSVEVVSPTRYNFSHPRGVKSCLLNFSPPNQCSKLRALKEQFPRKMAMKNSMLECNGIKKEVVDQRDGTEFYYFLFRPCLDPILNTNHSSFPLLATAGWLTWYIFHVHCLLRLLVGQFWIQSFEHYNWIHILNGTSETESLKLPS